jgi:hypothetical protein
VWPDTTRPLTPDPGTQFVRLRKDGVREMLFPQERYRPQIDTLAAKPLSSGFVADLTTSLSTASGCSSLGTTTSPVPPSAWHHLRRQDQSPRDWVIRIVEAQR